MNKQMMVSQLLGAKHRALPQQEKGLAFAPTNIALSKYWGKRDNELNLPVTGSLSISLGKKGALCTISCSDHSEDQLWLNQQTMALTSSFGARLKTFLDLFRPEKHFFNVNIELNIPFAAGLASSACGFASVVLALDDYFGWQLSLRELSILARLGSGSASRSILPGFVEWYAGKDADGLDSYSEMLPVTWSELTVGLLIVSQSPKPLSSSEAMKQTVATSTLYSAWPEKVSQDLNLIRQSVLAKDFSLLGKTAESNALNMHALMLSAWPPISYATPETVINMQKIWKLRAEGLNLYFTQDAGPNLKLLFLQRDAMDVQKQFPQLELISPFSVS